MKALWIAVVSVGMGWAGMGPVQAQTKTPTKAAVAPAKVDKKLLHLQAFVRKVKAAKAKVDAAYKTYAKALQSEQAYAAKAPTLRVPYSTLSRGVDGFVKRTSAARTRWLKALALLKGLKRPTGGATSERGAFRGCMIENKDRPYFQRVKFCRAAARAYRDALRELKRMGQ